MSGINMHISSEGLDELVKKFAESGPVVQKELGRAMFQSVNAIRNEVVPNVPVGVSSQLRNSIGSSVQNDGLSIVGEVGSDLKAEVYPEVMEFGRKPGKMPPPEALLRWVHLKLNPGKNEMGIAFLVARAIGKHGIPGHHFMQKGFDATKSKVNEFFKQAQERIIQALMR